MKDKRCEYNGCMTQCAWWDAAGPCTKMPRWQVTLEEGLCNEHDIMFHVRLRENPYYAEPVEVFDLERAVALA